MTREEMTDEIVTMWLRDLLDHQLEDLAREALMERYRHNYSDKDVAAEYAELIANTGA
jgi:hypothetical protein